MSGNTMDVVVLLVMAPALLAFPYCCSAAQYTVGDAQGWDISTDFGSWLSGKVFRVGDTLVFQYSSYHSLMEVTKAGYDSCQTANALQSYSDGNTQVRLSSPGEKYFICGTTGHCLGGMKLAVNVTSPAVPPSSTGGRPPAAPPVPRNRFPPSDSPPVSPTAKNSATGVSYGVKKHLIVIMVLWLHVLT